MTKRSLLFTLLFFVSIVDRASGSDLLKETTEVTATFGSSDVVHVTIVTPTIPNDYVYRTAFGWGGDETTAPKRIIAAIRITDNGAAVRVPLSAYADLGDPRQASLEALGGKGFRLLIVGGDAAGSYKASLEFSNGEIKRRMVASGEFPKQVWEKAEFSFNHLNN